MVSLFEIIMLVCFGISWPISVLKALRTKVVSGKSPWFMGIVMAGYISGILHKLRFSPDAVTLLYAFNLAMVGLDLLLYLHYYRKRPAAPARAT